MSVQAASTTTTTSTPSHAPARPTGQEPSHARSITTRPIDDRPSTQRSGRRPSSTRHRYRTEIAEGVISTAIAVLIVAFLGIALWKGFDVMMNSATDKTQHQVEQIGG